MFSDLKKAFDVVRHQPLMDKLHRYGLDVNTLAWIDSYLTNSKRHVSVDDSASSFQSTSRLCAGTPSFLIYIDDISTISFSEGSTFNLFADDMFLYKVIKSPEDLI